MKQFRIGLIVGITVGLVDIFRFEWLKGQGWGRTSPGILNTIINVSIISLIIWIVAGIADVIDEGLAGAMEDLVIRQIGLFSTAFIFGLFFGLRGSQRSLFNDVQPAEAFRWSWPRAGKGGLIVGILGALAVGLVRWL